MTPVEPNEASQRVIPEQPESAVANLWKRWRQERCPDFSDPAAGGLSAEQALAVLRYDQCQCWRAGERVPAERYLHTYSILKTDPDQAFVLIYGEFLLRQELGETPTLDEYLQRFPEWADWLRQQDEFHKAVDAAPLDWDTKFNFELTTRLAAELRKQPNAPPKQLMQLLRPPTAAQKNPRKVG